MPIIAFWNLNRNASCDVAVELLTSHGVDILVVAEMGFEKSDLLRAYQRATNRPLHAPGFHLDSSRVAFFSAFPADRFRDVSDDRHISIKEYRPQVGRSLLIAAVHLGSKLHLKTEEQVFEALRLRQDIDEAEKNCGHDRTIIIGDFNMNPFEFGMVASDALHSVMDRRVVQKGSRMVLGKQHRYFYNPMWRHMGDSRNEALGTYFRGTGSHVTYFWHTFDQVLLRPSLLDAFPDDGLRILDNINGRSLLSTNPPGIAAAISDHLPIVFELTT